jgi:hypothetical protein
VACRRYNARLSFFHALKSRAIAREDENSWPI